MMKQTEITPHDISITPLPANIPSFQFALFIALILSDNARPKGLSAQESPYARIGKKK